MAPRALADFSQHAEDGTPSLANSTKQVNVETNMKPILLTFAPLVLTGAAGSAAMMRSTAALATRVMPPGCHRKICAGNLRDENRRERAARAER
jgi:hypothetical protein